MAPKAPIMTGIIGKVEDDPFGLDDEELVW